VSVESSASFTHCFLKIHLNILVPSRHLNSGQNQNIRISNEWFKNVATFTYLDTTLTNQNDIHDETKSRLNSGNACYHSVQNLFSSRFMSKNLKI
jgi:hypothetical protein